MSQKASSEYTEIRVFIVIDQKVLLRENYCKDAKKSHLYDKITFRPARSMFHSCNEKDKLSKKKYSNYSVDGKISGVYDKIGYYKKVKTVEEPVTTKCHQELKHAERNMKCYETPRNISDINKRQSQDRTNNVIDFITSRYRLAYYQDAILSLSVDTIKSKFNEIHDKEPRTDVMYKKRGKSNLKHSNLSGGIELVTENNGNIFQHSEALSQSVKERRKGKGKRVKFAENVEELKESIEKDFNVFRTLEKHYFIDANVSGCYGVMPAINGDSSFHLKNASNTGSLISPTVKNDRIKEVIGGKTLRNRGPYKCREDMHTKKIKDDKLQSEKCDKLKPLINAKLISKMRKVLGNINVSPRLQTADNLTLRRPDVKIQSVFDLRKVKTEPTDEFETRGKIEANSIISQKIKCEPTDFKNVSWIKQEPLDNFDFKRVKCEPQETIPLTNVKRETCEVFKLGRVKFEPMDSKTPDKVKYELPVALDIKYEYSGLTRDDELKDAEHYLDSYENKTDVSTSVELGDDKYVAKSCNEDTDSDSNNIDISILERAISEHIDKENTKLQLDNTSGMHKDDNAPTRTNKTRKNAENTFSDCIDKGGNNLEIDSGKTDEEEFILIDEWYAENDNKNVIGQSRMDMPLRRTVFENEELFSSVIGKSKPRTVKNLHDDDLRTSEVNCVVGK